MKQSIYEHYLDRRAVRKANRVARLDTQASHRRSSRALLIILALLFVGGEAYLIWHAMGIAAQNRASELAVQAEEQLNLVSAAYISGDQALLSTSRAKYHDIVAEFNDNSYIRQQQQSLLGQLNDYDALLQNQDKITNFMNMRLAVLMLQSELSEINTEEVTVESVAAVRNSYQDFDTIIEKLHTGELEPIVEELQAFDKDIIDNLQSLSVCVGVCSNTTISSYQTKLDVAFSEHQAMLESFDRTISTQYSPIELVNALSMLE